MCGEGDRGGAAGQIRRFRKRLAPDVEAFQGATKKALASGLLSCDDGGAVVALGWGYWRVGSVNIGSVSILLPRCDGSGGGQSRGKNVSHGCR